MQKRGCAGGTLPNFKENLLDLRQLLLHMRAVTPQQHHVQTGALLQLSRIGDDHARAIAIVAVKYVVEQVERCW